MNYQALFRILNGFHAARVLVLGDLMLDRFVYGSVERISPEAPIPVVSVERFSDMPGGAANVARNIAAMGARVTLLGVVGEDASAQDLRIQLAASPTIEAHLLADPSRPTSVKTRYVADGQQVMRADRESRTALAADIEQSLLDRFSVALRDSAVVVLSDYAKGVLCDSVAHAAIDMARRAGKTIIVDPKAKDFGKYRGSTLLTPNRLELQQACGRECLTDDEVVDGARWVLDQKICDVMLVTRGKDGMSVIPAAGAAGRCWPSCGFPRLSRPSPSPPRKPCAPSAIEPRTWWTAPAPRCWPGPASNAACCTYNGGRAFRCLTAARASGRRACPSFGSRFHREKRWSRSSPNRPK